ncbi:galactose oxidase, partial [Massarina eburnea CBS 473.64]
MTNTKCQAACKAAGYIWAGTEYSGECFCDSQLRNGGGLAPDGNAGCNLNCNGAQAEICGGSNRLTVFKYQAGNDPASSSNAPSSTVIDVSSSISSTNTASATPTATGLPEGFTYKGCYVDGPGFRIMNFQQPDDNSLTVSSCSQSCASLGYTIAGMEYTYQCFCDNVIRQGGVPASDDGQCNMNCGGDTTQKCGGPDRLSIWSSQDVLKTVTQPVIKPKVDGWVYQGCITDAQQDKRVFPWQLVNKTGNSPDWCLGQCKKFGYQAAGMEYGEECYCGDAEGIDAAGSTLREDSECNTACPGDAESLCGAGLRLTWYRWEDDPLYVWEYPKGNQAGRYEFLVGGPVIPLISQPAKNGKVTFLEKLGTGPPNSTGAYEFDPSIGGDIFHAFRELKGIKSDLFCSAGLTMPDKAGRLINIGGWSLESTFGIRIYTPDGSPGVNGTNDWRENYQVLKLQKGRWYPTAMIMANGSMLVVGGEDGSNGAPVPSMEILPRAGDVLETDYLRQTDPFNLYPFLVVMPSSTIFIGYYNEARLLDEVSLNTVKILPKIPGAMNDANGGRTYPLEGTQVLLPQYYPYTEPLEVLICGGASQQPMWGIDNCVTIAPDAANPQWTIERMPSRRVLSCMATLPDGTYLILNGAEIGEAGFGLADSPNLNALLYDSRKPKHMRISIMANTTIARLYHSEAVLLDDGRVLVSGSDPQDVDFPQEYRVEQFLPPYLLDGRVQPQLSVPVTNWNWEETYNFEITRPNGNGDIKVSLLGSESSTHGNSMGARILFPQLSCAGSACVVTAPKGPYIAPVGWYRMYVLEGPTPSHAKWVRIGGDPAGLGNWPNYPDFQPLPGV